MKKLLIIILAIITISSCNSECAKTPEELVGNIVDAIKTSNKDKFISYFGTIEDYTNELAKQNLPSAEKDRMLTELEKRMDKYSKIPHQSYEEIMKTLELKNIGPSSLKVDYFDVKKSTALGGVKFMISVYFKESDFILYISKCVKYNRGFLSVEKIRIDDIQTD